MRPDLIIVARGGGSIEDLWAFNEEIVVRAAAASRIPLISAVGHETDTTLIDYASDRRAPTPTAAAEMAVPVREQLQQSLQELDARLQRTASRLCDTAIQKLDDWSERLLASLPALLSRKEQTLALMTARLQPKVLFAELSATQARLRDMGKRMGLAGRRLVEKKTGELAGLAGLLETLNYQRVLERGFVLVKNAGGKVVSRMGAAKQEKELRLVFADGELTVIPD
jgi:exodeoxyribonuclease VII large subunit